MLRAAAEGEGMALGRSILVAGDLAQGRLVAPFDVSIAATYSYWFVAPRDAPRRPEVELLREWLIEQFATTARGQRQDLS